MRGVREMYKRIIALLLTAAVISPIPAVAEATQLFANEVLEVYALNSTPQGLTVEGIDSRVVGTDDGNKALYTKMWGSGIKVNVPTASSSKMVFSFDIMTKGSSFVGKAISLGDNVAVINFTKNGIYLEDGYKIGTVKHGEWKTFTAAVDFENKRYDFYVDGRQIFKNRIFSTSISKPSSFSLSLSPLDLDSVTEVFVDNIRVYSGKKILKENDFPIKKYNMAEVDFTPTTDKPIYDKVYVNSNGREGLSSIEFAAKTDTVVNWASPEKDSPECVHMLQTGTTDCYVNLKPGVTEVKSFVYEFDVYPLINTGSSTLMRPIEGTKYSNMLSLRGGQLYYGTKAVKSIPNGKWTTIGVVCDYIAGVGDVYVDGECVLSKETLPSGVVQPQTIRFTIDTTGTAGRNEIYFNRIKAYEGYSLRTLEDVDASDEGEGNAMESGNYKSVHVTKQAAKDMLENDSVFMTNCDWYFAEGEKQKYSEYGSTAYADENGTAMVPAELLADVLKVKAEKSDGVLKIASKTVIPGNSMVGDVQLVTAPVEKDGVVYLPVASFARNVLSKYAYEDERGFVLISDVDRGYSNSPATNENLEESDILYRYMQYERPSGDELYERMLEKSHGTYPRAFIKNDSIAAFKKKIDSNASIKKSFASLLSVCDAYFSQPLVEYEIPDGLRLFLSCHEVRTRLINLGVVYMATGDEKYAERMWLEMENALSWENWNVDNHFLDSGEIGPGMAFAYDVLHDYLSDEQKAYFRERVNVLFLDAAVRCYTGDLYCDANNYRLTQFNWGAVCSNSMLLMSLVLMDEEDADSEITKKCKFIAENAVQSLEYPIGNFYPNGAVADGVDYWTFYMELSWSINALVNMCGSDFGLLDSPGFRDAPDYMVHIQSKQGWFNHSNTSGTGPFWCAAGFIVAQLYNDNEKMQLLNNSRELLGMNLDALGILWYEPSETEIDTEAPALDGYFGGEEVVTMHGSWEEEGAAFVGIRGGLIFSHSHYDKGTFIYDNGGERWFTDFGTEDYNIDGGYAGEGGKTLYRIRTEGHNGVVINPTQEHPGQTPGGTASVERFESKPKGSIAVFNLTDVYQGEVESYRRGFYMGDERETLTVQDEIKLSKNNSEFYHFLHTQGDVTINPDGKSATITKNGKTLKAEFICNAPSWKLEVRNAENLFKENDRVGERSREGYRKLTLSGTASGELVISVKFSLVTDYKYPSLEVTPIDSWTIEDGAISSKPKIDKLYMNGEEVKDFDATFENMMVTVSSNMPTPVFSATSENASISIKQPASLDDYAEITAYDAKGRKKVYTVTFNVLAEVVRDLNIKNIMLGIPADVELLPVATATASHVPQAENPPSSAVDGDFDTRWSADTSGAYIDVDLGEVKELSGIAMSFAWGIQRNYKYDLLVSEDKCTYTRVYQGASLGGTNEFEYIPVSVKARYVRLVGYGNNEGAWNSITELRPCAKK